MSFGKRFSIAMAMEEIEEQAEVAEQAVAEVTVEDPAEQAEPDVAEMVEAGNDVEGGLEQVDQIADDADTLDGIADKMEASEETGGLDETAAAITEVAVESLYKRLGVKRRKPMPAMESFGSQSNRVKATRIAVESIRDTLKKVWDGVVAMLVKIGEYLKKFYDAMFSGAAKMVERAKGLISKIKGNDGIEVVELSEEEAAKYDALFAAIANKDGVVDVDYVEKELDAAGNAVDAAAKAVKEAATDVESGDAAKAMAAGAETLDGAKSVTEAFSKMSEAKGEDTVGEGMRLVAVTPMLFDMAQVQAEIPAAGATGEEAVKGDAKSKVKLYIIDKAGKVKKVLKAGADKLVAMLNKVVEVLGKLIHAKQISEGVQKAYGKVTGAAKSAGTKVKETVSAAAKTLQRWATAAINFISKPFVYLGNLISRFCKGAMDFAQTLLNKVKGGKKEEVAAADDTKLLNAPGVSDKPLGA